MIRTSASLCLTLLLITPLIAAREEVESRLHSFEDEEEELAVSLDEVEHLPDRQLDLEDHGDWSASGEVLDENHAWFRRRRSLNTPQERSKFLPTAEEEKSLRTMEDGRIVPVTADDEVTDILYTQTDDMEVAESAVFLPSFVRLKKKLSYEECRKRLGEFNARRRHHAQRSHQDRWRCNNYCCFPSTSSL